MFAIFLVVIFQTTPIAAYWDPSVKAERSINSGVFAVSTAIITIITDVLVLAIPIKTFASLNMDISTRLGLIIIFLLGGL